MCEKEMFHLRFISCKKYRSKLINKKCLFLFIICVFIVIALRSFQRCHSSGALDAELVARQSKVGYRNWTVTRQVLADSLENKSNGNKNSRSKLGNKNELDASNWQLSAYKTHSRRPDQKPGTVRDSKWYVLQTFSMMPMQRNTAKLENHVFSKTVFSEGLRKNTLPVKQSLDTTLTLNKAFPGDLNKTKHYLNQRSVQTKINNSNVIFSDESAKLDEELLKKLNRTEKKNMSHTQQSFTSALCRKMLPDALIIGASKCGTGALAKFLSFHPGIAINPGKEFNFFSDHYDMGFKWYLERMPCSLPGQLTIERSSTYFMRPNVPERIRVMSKWTKIILIVCEPVRRAISHFTMVSATGKISNMSFSEFLFKISGEQIKINSEKDMIKVSIYSRYFPSWLNLFPFKGIHVVNGDILSKEPYQELSAVERFLDVGTYFTQTDFVFNSSKGFFCFRKGRIADNENHVDLEGKLNSSKFQTQNHEPYLRQNLNESIEIEKRQLTENQKYSGNIPGSEEMVCLGGAKGKKEHAYVPDKLVQFLKQYYKPYNEKFYAMAKRTFNW